MLPKIKPYNKKDKFTYASGTYLVQELLTQHPDKVKRVIVNPRYQNSPAVQSIITKVEEANIPIDLSEALTYKLTKKENTPIIAYFSKYTTALNNRTDHLVLIRPSNLGNLGTIIRTAVGLGVKDIALIRPAVDIFNPQVIRASMGAIFKIRWQYFDSLANYTAQIQKERTIYIFSGTAPRFIEEIEIKEPASFVFGPENSGITENDLKNIGTISNRKLQQVKLHQSKEIDSYNLAIAVGIGLYVIKEK